MEVRDVTTSRLRHAVAEAGSGSPLLLLHGFTGAKEDFADHLDALGERGWHVVAPDLRGHGASDKPADEDAYSLDILADDALALADAFGWDRFTLLGHSMGGMAAQVAALSSPERLASLVLMNTAHGPVQGLDPGLVELAAQVVREEGIGRLMELARHMDPREPAPAAVRLAAERPEMAAFGERKMRDSAPAMYASMAVQLTTAADRLEALRGLRVRTLVVVGEEDRGFVGPSRRLAAAIPGAALEVIADAAHSPQFENPEAWWSAVAGFLDAVPG